MLLLLGMTHQLSYTIHKSIAVVQYLCYEALAMVLQTFLLTLATYLTNQFSVQTLLMWSQDRSLWYSQIQAPT